MSTAIPLRNDHYVYILGAGYSVARGLPLISDFLNRMRDAAIWFETNSREREANAIQDVLRFRLNAAAAAYRVPIDLENIEELFSLASAADTGIMDSVKVSIAATLEYCRRQSPEPSMQFKTSGGVAGDFAKMPGVVKGSDPAVGVIPLYDAMAIRSLGVLRPAQSSIITFNYDDLIETSIERVGGSFNYGLRSRHENRFGPAYSDHGVTILKLHGSVNWASSEDKGFTVFRDYESLRLANLVPQIVPPTWNKTIAEQLSEVWFSAIERLSTATKIIVVGFSMPKTDQHFKYLLAAGMKDNLSLRQIVFVDPSEMVKTRASELLAEREIASGRVRHITATVESLIAKKVDGREGYYWFNDIKGRAY